MGNYDNIQALMDAIDIIPQREKMGNYDCG